MAIIYFILEAFFLNIALSIDTLMSGFAYGTNKIKIPKISMLIINLTCSIVLMVALFFGSFINNYINEEFSLGICVSILILLGLVKFLDGIIKQVINMRNGINKNIKFSFFSVKMTLNLYAKPEEADFDKSKNLSYKEAFAIAIALSLDSITIGFGRGMGETNVWQILVITALSFILGFIALIIGVKIGNKIANKTNMNLSWISGLLLIIIAIYKLFS